MANDADFSKPKCAQNNCRSESMYSTEIKDTATIISFDSEEWTSSSMSSPDMSSSLEILRRRRSQLPVSPLSTTFDDYHQDDAEQISTELLLQNETLLEKNMNKYFSTPLSMLVLFLLVCWIRFLSFKSEPSVPFYPIQQWQNFLQKDAPAILKRIQTTRLNKFYTIRLVGTRPDLVDQSIVAHSGCLRVKQIQIITDALPSTWKVPKGYASTGDPLTTNGVLLLQDDVKLTCDELDRAFRTWRQHPDQLVGFFPFHHDEYLYHGNKVVERRLFLKEAKATVYTMVSDRAVFVHKLYLNSFQSTTAVDDCQSVSLSIHVTAISGKAPIAIASKPQEMRHAASFGPYSSLYKYGQGSKGATDKCLERWIEGHNLQDLPNEEWTFIGSSYQ